MYNTQGIQTSNFNYEKDINHIDYNMQIQEYKTWKQGRTGRGIPKLYIFNN